MMVIRCLHLDESKRIGTIEAIEAISDHLGIVRCVFIAHDELEAMALQAAVLLRQADVDRMKISAGVAEKTKERQGAGLYTEHGSSTRKR